MPTNEDVLEQAREWLRHHARLLLDDRLRGKIDPSDIVQETLLKAYQHRGQLRGQSEGEQRAWLRQILVHTLADLVRRYLQARKRNAGREESLDRALAESSTRLERWLSDGEPPPEQPVEEAERLFWLATALSDLPEEQRLAMQLRHLEGLSVGAIARQMGRTPASVAGLLRRGLDALRQKAGDEDHDPGSGKPGR